jgi:hypothetical protein
VSWCNFTWRRGTVPIWWGVEMKSGGLGDVDVLIAAENPYRGTKRCVLVSPAASTNILSVKSDVIVRLCIQTHSIKTSDIAHVLAGTSVGYRSGMLRVALQPPGWRRQMLQTPCSSNRSTGSGNQQQTAANSTQSHASICSGATYRSGMSSCFQSTLQR